MRYNFEIRYTRCSVAIGFAVLGKYGKEQQEQQSTARFS